MKSVGSRRPYSSPRRAASAVFTRQTVLSAADSLFVRHGYAGTTLKDVAHEANVSLATVKLVAQTKGGLLLEAIKARVRGDAEITPLVERPTWTEMLDSADADELVRRWSALARAAFERQANLFEVLWQAAPGDPALAAVERRGSDDRRRDVATVIDAIDRLGALRRDLHREEAIDIVWVIGSPLTFRLFARAGWTPDRWERWISQALVGQLLETSARSGPIGPAFRPAIEVRRDSE